MRHARHVRHASCAALDALSARVAGLFFSFRDPEAFHLEKHDIACQLQRLAEAMRREL
jgi:hypothetical protein